MPTTTYMKIDPRHDHSLRMPQPDLSVKFGTPNACNNCHRDRDARWAAQRVKKRYGHDPQGYQRFAAAFSAANADRLDALTQLRAIADDDSSEPAIARTTALAQITVSMGSSALETLTRGLRDPNPLLRLAALQSLTKSPLGSRPALIGPLLSDSAKAVRVEAAALLAPVSAEQLNPEQRAANEYVETQRYNGDRAEARVNLGIFYANRGDLTKAKVEIKAAIELDPLFIPAYVNLADMDRLRGHDEDGVLTLHDGLQMAPQNAMLHHALGLALVRQNAATKRSASSNRRRRLSQEMLALATSTPWRFIRRANPGPPSPGCKKFCRPSGRPRHPRGVRQLLRGTGRNRGGRKICGETAGARRER